MQLNRAVPTPPIVAPLTAVILLAALVVGYLASTQYSILVLGLAAAGLGISLMAIVGRGMPRLFLILLTAALVGYAFLSRGFAYWGVAPLFLGEALLGLAVAAAILLGVRQRFGRLQWLLVAYLAFGLAHTLPYVSSRGLDTIRDAAFWYYALFAVLISMLVQRHHILKAVALYQWFVPVFLIWVPIAALIWYGFPGLLPDVPGSNTPVLVLKSGDVGVHLGAIAAFVGLGLYSGKISRYVPAWVVWSLWLMAFAIAGGRSRGGLLSAGTGLAIGTYFSDRRARLWSIVLPGIAALALVVLVNPSFETAAGRTVSLNQLVSNVSSVTADSSDTSQLAGTRDWRLRWWNTIIDYTIQGEYRWTGRGFGVSLAETDGFTTPDGNRSPHSAHMNALARMGVPGLVFWLTIHVTFGIAMWRGIRRAKRAGDRQWAALLAWLLAIWAAALMHASFDVYLEGPQGAIWLWTVVGLGIAALRLGPRPRLPRRATPLERAAP